MASKYPQFFLPGAISALGDKTVPPLKAAQAGEGRLSIEEGWGRQNAVPLDEGGIPPRREDFNGAFFLLSQLLLWLQQGGQMEYDATMAYEPNNEVFFFGEKYRCLKACTGIQPTDRTYWKNLDRGSALNGAVMPYYNARVGGSDGRRLIPWGSNDADETWILCDGGSDGQGGTVPNLIDRFMMGSDVRNAKEMGGNTQVRLTSANLPAHTHGASLGTSGSHYHSRGSMNITGQFISLNLGRGPVDGAFYRNNRNHNANMKYGGNDDWLKGISFEAARSWSGVTSTEGGHTHSINISSTGSGSSFTVIPPFYKLAFFVKVYE